MKLWILHLICCGRSDGYEFFETWEEADAFRVSYCDGPEWGHDRQGIIK